VCGAAWEIRGPHREDLLIQWVRVPDAEMRARGYIYTRREWKLMIAPATHPASDAAGAPEKPEEPEPAREDRCAARRVLPGAVDLIPQRCTLGASHLTPHDWVEEE
jgi:hypothetical protein